MRQVTDQDFDTIYNIYMDETVNPFMSYDPMSKEEFKKVFEEVSARDYFWIFENDNEPYGMCTISIQEGRANKTAYLGSLGIKKTRQGQGLGRKILSQVEGFLKDNGFKTLFFYVESDNERGVKFYEALGFEETGRIPSFFQRQNEDGEYFIDEILFSKVLTD